MLSDHQPLTTLFNFFVRRVLAADAAELFQLKALRHRLPVLGRRIVPLFAISALQRDDLSGHKQLLAFSSIPNVSLEAGRFRPARRARRPSSIPNYLLHNLADGSRAYRVPAFADGKP